MKKISLAFLWLFALGLFVVSCSDDWDDNPQSTSANDFVWKGLNQYYYWLTDSPDLADTRFTGQNDYTQFLESFASPIDLFDHLKVSDDIDRFSVIYSDYTLLEQALTGTSESNGVDYELRYAPNSSTDVFGWVRYILPNTDASTKDIHRGDIFYAIDGVSLTVNNYSSLLGQTTYTLYLADIVNGQIVPNGNSVTLTKSVYSENPVYLKTTYTIGSKKIGYLIYNGFYTAYESELNNAFAYFQAEGITHLILDLRYNSGGSVATATRLASMITGQFTGQIFAQQEWNYKMNDYYSSNPEKLLNRFTNSIDNGAGINHLNLDKIYIITSKRTASASELVINGLTPYINVTQIGNNTTGKNVGSVTLYDSPTFTKNNVNPNHRYAMQPIVLRISNVNNFSDYSTNGLPPDVTQLEDLENLGVLGDSNEPLLSTALNYVNTNGRFTIPNQREKFVPFEDKNSKEVLKTEMYIELPE
ncbi:S41 family peptidase [Flavobacterium sp. U410]